jgi:hypothetical protein
VYEVHVTDDEGDDNRMTVARDLRVRDDGPRLAAGPHCSISDDGWSACVPPARSGATTLVRGIQMHTGAGADVLLVDGDWYGP